jgi:hypothetical protein
VFQKRLDGYVEDAIHFGVRTVNEVVKYVKTCVLELESHEEKQVRSYATDLLDMVENSSPPFTPR